MVLATRTRHTALTETFVAADQEGLRRLRATLPDAWRRGSMRSVPLIKARLADADVAVGDSLHDGWTCAGERHFTRRRP